MVAVGTNRWGAPTARVLAAAVALPDGHEAPVFATKLRPPHPQPDDVVRSALLPLLDRACEGRTVLVRGPVGSGKTRLVGQWLRRRPDRQVAWVSLDRADADPARLLRYVLAAVRSTPAGAAAFAALAPLPSGVPVTEQHLGAWQRAADSLTVPVVLVLDGVEQVAGTPAATLVARLCTHLPERAGLVLISQSVPDLPLARLELEGRLTEIGSADLAVTRDELRQCLAAAGVDLDEDQVGELHRTTGGWCVGVALAVAALRDVPDPEEVSRALAGNNRRLHDFLLQEVFARQPEQVRRFLLRTCVSDRICPDLADALTGGPHAAEVLDDLEREQVFLQRTDADPPWYRWHPLFAAFLRSRLHESDPAAERTLHRVAGRWWRTQGACSLAVDHLVRAAEVPAAVDALGQCWVRLVLSGEVGTVRAMLAALGEPVCWRAPEAAVATAFVHLVDGDVALARRWARQGVEAPGPPGEDRRAAVAEMAAVVRLRCATLDGAADGLRVRAAALRLLAEEAPNRDRRVRRALLLYHLGAFATAVATGGREHLEAALAESERLGLDALALRSRAELVIHQGHGGGEVTAARSRATEVLAAAEERGWGDDGALAGLHLYAAHLALLQADVEAALDHLERTRAVLSPVDLLHRTWLALLTGQALRAVGEVRDAARSVQGLRELMDDWAAPDWVVVMLHVATAEQSLAEQLLTGAPPTVALEVLAHVPVPVPDGPVGALHAAALARARLRDGDASGAREVLREWTGPENALPERVGALVLDAVATDALGDRDAALDALDLALRLADGTHRILGPVVTAAPEVRHLLACLLDRGTGNDEVATEALRLVAAAPPVRAARPASAAPYVERLSRRELEVLRMLQGTATNTEIAARLFISLNTLRSHMKAINRKLGSTDRRDAVRRARELGIL